MSIIDSCTIQTASAANTALAGAILASSLPVRPITIDLIGEMGGGKTTFVQGLAKGLKLAEHTPSPTFALEQRYGDMLCHIDLCRLSASEATRLLHQSDDFPGIRAIEWADKSTGHTSDLSISFEDHRVSRTLAFTFRDIAIPSEEQIRSFLDDVMLPVHIRKHTEAVAHVAKILAEDCLRRGIPVRVQALVAAARLHDMLRFVDFHSLDDGYYEKMPTAKEKARWMELQKQYANMRHEPSAAAYLTERGFREIGNIILSHRGTASPATPLPNSMEEKLLCYADKRVDLDRIVRLDTRFSELILRHTKNANDAKEIAWQQYIRSLEQELFPDGPPL